MKATACKNGSVGRIVDIPTNPETNRKYPKDWIYEENGDWKY